MCGGGGAPPPPAIDPAAQELQQRQLDLLKEQQRQQEIFQPLQAEQYGYETTYERNPVFVEYDNLLAKRQQTSDPNEIKAIDTRLGELQPQRNTQRENLVSGYTKTAARAEQDKQVAELQTSQMETAKRANDALNKYLDSLDTEDYKAYQKAQQDLQAQQTQIALQQGERTQKALNGELPLSQGTIDRKAQDFQMLKENLARGGNAIIGDDPNSAYSLSSPGEQALKEFNTRYASVEDQERRGALDTGTSAYLQAVGLAGNLGKSDLSAATGLSQPGGYAATSTSMAPGASPVQNNLSLVQGYGSAMNPYLQQQQMQWQTGQNNAQISAQDRAGWLQLGGTLAGAGGTAALMMSSRTMKKNIEAIKSEKDATKAIAKTPVYRWNYKSEPDGYKRHLGTMTEEAPEDVVAEDGKHLDIASYLGLLTLSTRDLHGRVLSLEGGN